MSLIKLKIIGVVISFLLCFPLHFLYDKFPSFFTSIVVPVNESIWEHMKLLFSSILISGIIQKVIIRGKKINVNNVCFASFVGAIISIPIFLIIFLPIYFIIGENFVVTIIIMFITILISEIISCMVMKKADLKLEGKTIFFVIIVYVIFGILTYFPLDNFLFEYK